MAGKITQQELNPSVNGFYMDLPYYYNTNVRPIVQFQPDETWGSVIGKQSPDTTNVKLGSQSLKIASETNSVTWLYSTRTITALDLTKFPDSSASSTGDYIRFVFYISAGISKITDVNILLGTNSSVGYYTTIPNAQLTAGWNYKNVLKSSFTQSGSQNWNNITFVNVGWDAAINSFGEYVSFQLIDMVRVDPISSSFPNQFQKNVNGTMTRDFTINFTTNYTSPFFFLGNEFNQLVTRNFNPASNGTAAIASSLVGTTAYSTICVLHSLQKCYTANYSAKLVWEQDANNRVYALVNNGNLTINETASGTDGTAVTMTCALNAGDLVDMTLTMKGSVATIECIVNGNTASPYVLTKTLTVTGNGYLALSNITTNNGTVLSLESSTISNVDHANKADWAASVGMGTWEKLSSTVTAVDVASINIPVAMGYKHYKVILSKAMSSTATVRDLYLTLNSFTTNYGGTLSVNSGVNGSNVTSALMNWSSAYNLQKALAINFQGFVEILINNVDVSKPILAHYFTYYAGALAETFGAGGIGNSLSPISSIQLSASADSIKAGINIDIWGAK